jgi:UDP-N-acetyl-D-glucosamine dehydrogenase
VAARPRLCVRLTEGKQRLTLEQSDMDPVEEFVAKVNSRNLVVGVMGLGYVGLPIAVSYAKAGFRTIAYDTDPDRIAALKASRSYVEDVSSQDISQTISTNKLVPTSDPSMLGGAEAVFICVPTPYTVAKDPDLSYVVAASKTLAEHMGPGTLVILQSTTYPGTTNEVVKPILEAGVRIAGRDFDLAFSPERVDPGNKVYNIENTPKVVGGVTEESTAKAAAVLAAPMRDEVSPKVVRVSGPEVAEMTKLLENTFRAVNIALVNELALLCQRMGVDVWEVVEAAATKPFGFMSFKPGPGVGGHCIAVDPYYLAWRARTYDFQAKFIELAAEANSRMPSYVAQRVSLMLNSAGLPVWGSRILALGAAFKPGVSDTRNSPAIAVMEILQQWGAHIVYSDPRVPRIKVGDTELESVPLDREVVELADIVVALVAHPDFDTELVLGSARMIFDAVNMFGGRPSKGRMERL